MLKISKTIIAPFQSYSIFLRGLFFMPHPVHVISEFEDAIAGGKWMKVCSCDDI